MSLGEFFHMGGYAFYVWMSCAVTLVVLVANLLAPRWQRRRLLDELARKARRSRRQQERAARNS